METSAIQFGYFWLIAEQRQLIPTAHVNLSIMFTVMFGAGFPVIGVVICREQIQQRGRDRQIGR